MSFQDEFPGDGMYNNEPTYSNKPAVNPLWFVAIAGLACALISIVGVGMLLVTQRDTQRTQNDLRATQTAAAALITPSPTATVISEFDLTATAVVTNWQVTPSPTFLPAIDTIGYSVTTTPTPDPFMAQSGGVWQPTVTPFPYITPVAPPVWLTPVPWATPIPYATPVPYIPLPTVEPVTPPSMPPLVVSQPVCGTNPLYLGYDPRIGCRMPVGEYITSAQLSVNNVWVTNMTNVIGWDAVSTPPVAAPGQMIIWQTYNSMGCVAWNPNVQLSQYDSVYVRLNTNTGRVMDQLIIVHPTQHTINPWPAAHACGFSPDRTRLRAEVGDTLSRFMLGLDLQPTNALWTAWWNLHHTYNLTVGQEYAVPPEWLYGTTSGGK